jgi:glyoxylase-like metal-dependent hydrolase (beta-lactamase superfamily II)
MKLSFRVAARLLAVAGIAGAALPTQGQDGMEAAAAAARAMGADSLKTLTLSGSGSSGTLGQNVNPTSPWPLVRLARYAWSIDFEAMAASFEATRLAGGQEVAQSQTIPAKSGWSRQAELWVVTPFAFLKGATTNPTTVRSEVVDGTRYTVVSFKVDGRYTVEGYISDQNVVGRVRTWIDNDVLGNMPVDAVYRDYVDFGGVKVPTLTIVRQGGFPTLIAGVSDAKPNAPVSIPNTAPSPPTPAPVAVTIETVAEGVHYLKGGSHHSVLVEFADHVALIEAPQNDARAMAILQAVKTLSPRKPLTQVINTHHHFDHAGGLRTFVDTGATIITHDINKGFYQAAFTAPRTISPDRLQLSKRKPAITGVTDKLVLSDATRTVELHALKGNAHDEGMLVAFLPREKIVVEVDMYTPPAPGSPAPAADAPVNPNTIALIAGLEKLRLDFETILPLHGPGKATRADLYAFARKPLVPVAELPDPDAPQTDGRGGRPRGTALPPPDLGGMP